MTNAVLFVIAAIFLPALAVIGLFFLFRKKGSLGRRAARWYFKADILTQLAMLWGVVGFGLGVADIALGRGNGSSTVIMTPVVCLILFIAGYALEETRRSHKRVVDRLFRVLSKRDESRYLLPFAADAAGRIAAAYKLADEWTADDGLLLKETAGMDLAHAMEKHRSLPDLPPSILDAAPDPEE